MARLLQLGRETIERMPVSRPRLGLRRELHILLVGIRQGLRRQCADWFWLPADHQADSLVVSSVDEDKPGNLLWKPSLVGTGVDTAQGCADQDIGRPDIGLPEQQVQVVHDLFDAVGGWSAIAPCVPGAIVGANPGEFGNLWLHQSPLDGKAASAVLDDDGGRAGTGAIQM